MNTCCSITSQTGCTWGYAAAVDEVMAQGYLTNYFLLQKLLYFSEHHQPFLSDNETKGKLLMQKKIM